MEYICSMQRQDAKSLALFRVIQAKLSYSDVADRRACLAEAKHWAEEAYRVPTDDEIEALLAFQQEWVALRRSSACLSSQMAL